MLLLSSYSLCQAKGREEFYNVMNKMHQDLKDTTRDLSEKHHLHGISFVQK